jgi:YHS domain-containing protein
MSFDAVINIAIFAAALFLMVRFGCGRHMMGHAHSHAHAGAPGGGSGGPPVAPNEDVDPVCGMVVNTSSAITATFEGKTYYFCSDSCRKKFEASPTAYSPKASAPPRDAGHRHGCC